MKFVGLSVMFSLSKNILVLLSIILQDVEPGDEDDDEKRKKKEAEKRERKKDAENNKNQ